MRFLVLGSRRFSSADKHRRRPAQIDAFAAERAPSEPTPEDAEIEALLQELGEDPFDLWATLCAPTPEPSRSSLRTRRTSKPRASLRRKASARS